MAKKKAREVPLEELIGMFKTLQENEKEQDCVVQKFQMIIQNEGLFSDTIKCLECYGYRESRATTVILNLLGTCTREKAVLTVRVYETYK